MYNVPSDAENNVLAKSYRSDSLRSTTTRP